MSRSRSVQDVVVAASVVIGIPLFIVVSLASWNAWRWHRLPCKADVCAKVFARFEKRDEVVVAWLAEQTRRHPTATTFAIIQIPLDPLEMLDPEGDFATTSYDRSTSVIDDGTDRCGCGGGWRRVTDATLVELLRRGRGFDGAKGLGCEEFP